MGQKLDFGMILGLDQHLLWSNFGTCTVCNEKTKTVVEV
jgi:hypothetical protein